MSKSLICGLALAVSALLLAGPASARTHHHRHYRHYRHHAGSPLYGYTHSHVIPRVLAADPYGDVIIDGKTGFHRSDFGVMVPDSEPPSFVATGRATGTGLGANGLPGQNWQ